MPRAVWKGRVIAEAADTEVQVVEGNTYFPPGRVDRAFLRDSSTHIVCAWKGTCSYCDVVVDGQVNKDAAWFYPDTLPKAKSIEGYIAFWKGVSVTP